MTTKQYLNQIDRANKTINNKLSEVYQLKQIVCSISVSVSDDRVQSSGSKDKLGDAVSKIIDLENEINTIIDGFMDKKQKIVNQIENIEDNMQYQVLFSRYIEGKTFESIAEETNYSVRQILRIHGNALVEFEKEFGCFYL